MSRQGRKMTKAGFATSRHQADFDRQSPHANHVAMSCLHIEGNLSQKTHGLWGFDGLADAAGLSVFGTRLARSREPEGNLGHYCGTATTVTEIQGPDTPDICYATQNRQSTVRDLRKPAAVSILVGSTTVPVQPAAGDRREVGGSGNLADGIEFRPGWPGDARTISVTAGASAPEVLVDDKIEALRRIGPVTVPVLLEREEHIEFRLPAELTTVD